MSEEKKKRTIQNLNLVNRKASFEYAFIAKFIAGIQLTGTEVKSVRGGHVNMSEAYCIFEGEDLYVKNLHISEFKTGGYLNHEPLRKRKLLLKKAELKKIRQKLAEKGLTIIPIRIFISETAFIKVEIAIARGKKAFDKREDLKKRDTEREIRKAIQD
ncbi:MAG: SsrA-binding protein SmpB [Bacteroidia bacterium]|nr:SsrA-binding protein SmpB [Bacteroidia bacterium]